jgi:hypothetical protein
MELCYRVDEALSELDILIRQLDSLNRHICMLTANYSELNKDGLAIRGIANEQLKPAYDLLLKHKKLMETIDDIEHTLWSRRDWSDIQALHDPVKEADELATNVQRSLGKFREEVDYVANSPNRYNPGEGDHIITYLELLRCLLKLFQKKFQTIKRLK